MHLCSLLPSEIYNRKNNLNAHNCVMFNNAFYPYAVELEVPVYVVYDIEEINNDFFETEFVVNNILGDNLYSNPVSLNIYIDNVLAFSYPNIRSNEKYNVLANVKGAKKLSISCSIKNCAVNNDCLIYLLNPHFYNSSVDYITDCLGETKVSYMSHKNIPDHGTAFIITDTADSSEKTIETLVKSMLGNVDKTNDDCVLFYSYNDEHINFFNQLAKVYFKSSFYSIKCESKNNYHSNLIYLESYNFINAHKYIHIGSNFVFTPIWFDTNYSYLSDNFVAACPEMTNQYVDQPISVLLEKQYGIKKTDLPLSEYELNSLNYINENFVIYSRSSIIAMSIAINKLVSVKHLFPDDALDKILINLGLAQIGNYFPLDVSLNYQINDNNIQNLNYCKLFNSIEDFINDFNLRAMTIDEKYREKFPILFEKINEKGKKDV